MNKALKEILSTSIYLLIVLCLTWLCINYVGQRTQVSGSFAWIKTRIIYPWFVRHAMSPSRFSVTDACVSCGRCASHCPLGNITMQPSQDNPKALRPDWGNDCAGCLGCYHVCPVHAVNYTSATRNKGQYYFGIKRNR